jgi:hypothetical protein
MTVNGESLNLGWLLDHRFFWIPDIPTQSGFRNDGTGAHTQEIEFFHNLPASSPDVS